jgi:hypothetical protein
MQGTDRVAGREEAIPKQRIPLEALPWLDARAAWMMIGVTDDNWVTSGRFRIGKRRRIIQGRQMEKGPDSVREKNR